MLENVYYTYACKTCESETGETVIVNTPKEPTVFPGSFASPEAIAHIMTQKFVTYSPLYRQEHEMNRAGLKLSRQTVSNWILHASNEWLKPVYDELHLQLCGTIQLIVFQTAADKRNDLISHHGCPSFVLFALPGTVSQSQHFFMVFR